MKIWDLRSASDSPSTTFMLSAEQIAVTTVAQHPTQRHLIIAGDEEGSITVWDLRHNTFPINMLSAHAEAVSEMQFHPDHPDVLCSASTSGELWLWRTSRTNTINALLGGDAEENPWCLSEGSKSKLETFWMIPRVHKPINCLDLDRNKALCGCDNEAIYLVNDINVLS